jgi:hypothetical protein
MWSRHLDNLLEIWGTCSGLEDLMASLLRTVGSFDFPSHVFAEFIDMAVPGSGPRIKDSSGTEVQHYGTENRRDERVDQRVLVLHVQ